MFKVSPPSPNTTDPPGVRVKAPVVVNVVEVPSKDIFVSATERSPFRSVAPETVRVERVIDPSPKAIVGSVVPAW